MEKMHKVILLFTCDEWKSRDSMRLVGIFLDPKAVRKAAKTLIKNEVIELEAGCNIEKVDTCRIDELGEITNYLHVYIGYDGEFEEDGGFLV
jgi:hypothetical protein